VREHRPKVGAEVGLSWKGVGYKGDNNRDQWHSKSHG